MVVDLARAAGAAELVAAGGEAARGEEAAAGGGEQPPVQRGVSTGRIVLNRGQPPAV